MHNQLTLLSLLICIYDKFVQVILGVTFEHNYFVERYQESNILV